jgi:hypothetical protein
MRVVTTMALVAGALCLRLAVGSMGDVPRSDDPVVLRPTTTTAVPVLPPTTDRVVPLPAVPAEPVLLAVGDGAGQIEPGLYTHATEGDCLWERRDYLGQQVIESRRAPRLLVEMGPNEQLFSQGCGPWHRYVTPGAPATTFGDGDRLVGADVRAGVYRSSGAAGGATRCRWKVVDGFGQFARSVDHGFSTGPTEATLPRNHRFTSTGCATWTLVDSP